MQTRPDRRDFPAQRINIDVCAIPGYEVRPMLLLNAYGVEMEAAGLILQVESRKEIFTDKLVAFALLPNRIKHRDLWDMAWLHQQGIKPQLELLHKKLNDHHCLTEQFSELAEERAIKLKTDPRLALEFKQEMQRFLPAELVTQTVNQTLFWDYLINLVQDLLQQSRQALSEKKSNNKFQM